MTTYDYMDVLKNDVKDWIKDNMDTIKAEYDGTTRADLHEFLEEYMWADDGVTGNGSGSYTFNVWKAQDNVLALDNNNVANIQYLARMVQSEWIDKDTFADKIVNDDWEYFDVYIRCYLLNDAISAVLENDFYDIVDSDAGQGVTA